MTLLGARYERRTQPLSDFLKSHDFLLKYLHLHWAAVSDQRALPSPERVLSWL